MDGFTYTLALAFSGADLWRAVGLSLIGSLFCGRRHPVLVITVILFLIDRVLPYIGMIISGYGPEAVISSVLYQLQTLPEDAVPMMIRFAGMGLLCAAAFRLRLLAHHKGDGSPRLFFPY